MAHPIRLVEERGRGGGGGRVQCGRIERPGGTSMRQEVPGDIRAGVVGPRHQWKGAGGGGHQGRCSGATEVACVRRGQWLTRAS